MELSFFEFQCPTRIIFEPGAVKETGRVASELGIERPLVVTDKVLRQAGVAQRVLDHVTPVAVFDDVPQDSDVACVGCGRDAGEGADGIIAVGGGSVLDTAKAINLVLSLGGQIQDWQGAGNIPKGLKPMLFVPTTAGTGSEVSPFAAIKDHECRSKLLFCSWELASRAAILDPELTAGLPPKVTAASGMDAMTHAVEAIFAVNSNPIVEAMASFAIRTIRRWLPKAVQNGSDLEARSNMLIAATIAGIAFSNSGVGIVHACSHAMGAILGVAHGLANSLMLPHGVRYNLERVPHKRAVLAAALGTEDVAGELELLAVEAHLPIRLRDAGVKETDLPSLAEYAVNDGSMIYNPREASAEDILQIYKGAW